MKKLILAVLIILLIPAFGFCGMLVQKIVSAACADSSCTGFLICQNFETETTGYDNSESWTMWDDSPSAAYTTNPIRGSQSFYCSNTAQYETSRSPTFTGQSTFYGHVAVKFSDATPLATLYFLQFKNSSGTDKIFFTLTTGGNLWVQHGSVGLSGSTTLANNTVYHIWYTYTKSDVGSANGELDVWISTGVTKPGSTDISFSNGNSEDDIERIQIGKNSVVGEVWIDQILIDDNSIGNVCE